MSIDTYEVVKKLIGEIEPVGESHTDSVRFENLKEMTDLIDKLVTDINRIAFLYQNNVEHSMKQASKYSSKFLSDLGIKE